MSVQRTIKPCWDRHDMESGHAYAAFKLFLSLGLKRTVAEASKQYHAAADRDACGTQVGRIKRASGRVREWAKRHDWQARAAAWDAEQDRLDQLELAQTRREMIKRHAADARSLAGLARRRFAKLIERVADDPNAIEQLSLDEARHLYAEAVKLERLTLGEPSAVEERRLTGRDGGPIEVRELTDQELTSLLTSLVDTATDDELRQIHGQLKVFDGRRRAPAEKVGG